MENNKPSTNKSSPKRVVLLFILSFVLTITSLTFSFVLVNAGLVIGPILCFVMFALSGWITALQIRKMFVISELVVTYRKITDTNHKIYKHVESLNIPEEEKNRLHRMINVTSMVSHNGSKSQREELKKLIKESNK